MRKRGNGEGSIFQRNDGRWAATITVGYSTGGKRLRKTIYGPTKKSVTEQLTRLQNQRLDGTLRHQTKLTVSDLIDRWLNNWADNLTPGSLKNYRDIADRFITPALGGADVAKVQPVHVRAMLDKLKDDGTGERTRQYVFATLRRAMNLALKLELVLRNPCDAVDAPKAKPDPIDPPTDDEVSALLAAVAGSQWEALFVLACDCGLRQGELFALSWDDIDLDRRTLSVRHSLEEIAGQLRIKEPKSASGRRVVKLSQTAVEALQKHKKRLEGEDLESGIAGKIPSPWLFTDADGGFLRKPNFHRNVWKPFKTAAGLPDRITFHDLRHAHASILLRQNVHPKIVQERMGHSSIKLTMDTYSHLTPDAQDVAADAIDRARRNRSSTNGCQMAVKPAGEGSKAGSVVA